MNVKISMPSTLMVTLYNEYIMNSIKLNQNLLHWNVYQRNSGNHVNADINQIIIKFKYHNSYIIKTNYVDYVLESTICAHL